jgi:cardiolipin synthase (CMP-forming)
VQNVIANLPNLISIVRILLVPFTIWLLISQAYAWAFAAFIVAGISDAVDGYIARRFNCQTELGAYVDPLADKALLVSIFVALGLLQVIPTWIVILVVTRDVLIISAVMLSWVMGKPLAMQPLWISKVNTTMQIVFAGSVLGMLGTGINLEPVLLPAVVAVAILTVASGAMYMMNWMKHMATTDLE